MNSNAFVSFLRTIFVKFVYNMKNARATKCFPNKFPFAIHSFGEKYLVALSKHFNLNFVE